MPVDIATLRAAAAAGATTDVIIAMVEQANADDEQKARARRAADAKRKRASRMSAGLRRTPRDIADAAQPIAAVANPKPQLVVSNDVVSNIEEGGQKERSPTPPKEKLLPTSSLSLFEEDSRGSVSARARRNERATRLPDDWQPNLDDLAFARSLLTELKVKLEIEKFRDYWHAKAGQNAVKKSWPATWRNWCRKEAENGGENGRYRNGRYDGAAAGSPNSSWSKRAVYSATRASGGATPT